MRAINSPAVPNESNTHCLPGGGRDARYKCDDAAYEQNGDNLRVTGASNGIADKGEKHSNANQKAHSCWNICKKQCEFVKIK